MATTIERVVGGKTEALRPLGSAAVFVRSLASALRGFGVKDEVSLPHS